MPYRLARDEHRILKTLKPEVGFTAFCAAPQIHHSQTSGNQQKKMTPISPIAVRKRPLELGPDPSEHIDKHPRNEIPTPSGEATGSRKQKNTDPQGSDRLRRLHGVNRSVMGMLDGVLSRDPNADLSTLLKSHAQVYPGRRKKAEERALKGDFSLCNTLVYPPPTN